MARIASRAGAALLMAFVWLGVPGRARAADPPNVQKAAAHFQRAQELYEAGNYGEARLELQRAHALDPSAKELVYNLGIVSEKLGKIRDALHWFHQYVELDVDARERARAETVIRRLEGVKEIHEDRSPLEAPKTIIVVRESPRRGRIDVLTLSAATLAVGGFAVGAALGAMALSERPRSSFVTGKDGTYADLQRRVDSAYTKAIGADVGFVVGFVGVGATALLFFGRTRDPQSAGAKASVGAAPLPGGAVAFVGGAF